MSRAAILIALSRVLKRQPTPEDMATFCAAALEACPEGRVYVSARIRDERKQAARIHELHEAGLGIRAIARELNIGRCVVRETLRVGPKSACSQTHP